MTYETRLALCLAAGVWCSFAGSAAVAKALRARRAEQKYLFGWWDGGGLLKGREVHPRSGLLYGLAFALGGVVLLVGVAGGRWPHRDIAFRLPAGWLDVSSDAAPVNIERVPAEARDAVRSNARGVARYAIDLDGYEGGAFASFSGGQFQGDGKLTEGQFVDLVKRILEHAGAADRAHVLSQAIQLHGAVTMGRAVVDVEGEGPLRMFLYVFARGTTFALLACTMPRAWASRYEAMCDATAELNVRANIAR